MEEKRLFLLDAYALIYRAYYALIRSPRITSKGFNVSAIFGFCNTLDEILRKENPSHIAVCFDPPGGHTFRHDMYPAYKAQRDKQPEDITASIPYIKDILAAYRIPVLEFDGYEADDVIGSLARIAENAGFVTYMMTPDKDYGQLVTDNVLMYRPSLRGEGFEIRTPEKICERYGITHPRQVIDLLALEGDASDNIPGCPGVGEKTAAKLIAEWGSVENLLDHTDCLKGALQRKIADNAEQIRFSKKLVTIKTDIPFDNISLDDLIRQETNTQELITIYRELEFRTFIKRLDVESEQKTQKTEPLIGSLFDLPEESGTTSNNSLISYPHNYVTADSPESITEIINQACTKEHVAVSLYAEGDEAMTAVWKAIAVSEDAGNAVYIQIPRKKDEQENIIAILRRLFNSEQTCIVSHDIKRDHLLLKRAGIPFSGAYYDISVAHYLLEPEMKHSLPMLAKKYLDYDMIESSTSVDAVTRLCECADVTLRLLPELSQNIKQQQLDNLLSDIEFPLIRVLAEMEWSGVRVDVKELSELSIRYSERLAEMENEVYRLAGVKFNISSPMQVGDILFDKLKIDSSAKRTKKGTYSTTEEILEKHRAAHPIVDLILKIRALKKLLTTYINALPALINRTTGKIHTSYNQTITATGRLSSTNPNLQNIPIRSDDGREIRHAFIAEPGDIFMSADYSQIELRLMADLSGDPDMIEAFREGADIHRATASKIYHTPIDKVTDNQRRNAKTANFGIIYGISAFGLSERLSIPRSEAKELISGYFATYPSIRNYMEKCIENARTNGYVSTIMGRKRMLPDINSRNAVVRGYAERNAINAPLQGSAADIIKLAMVRIYDIMQRRNLRSRMIMQVHDELIFNVVPDELETMKEIVINTMQQAYSGRVPLEVSAGTGKNWLEAH